MDINIASFGIDLRSVSRVYFTNPVLNVQVEKQAIGRARRIGQMKQITVETLVLRDSVDEVVIKRREQLHTTDPSKRISLLDDQPTNAWIRNPRILPLPVVVDTEYHPTLMAKLDTQYLLWPQEYVDSPPVDWDDLPPETDLEGDESPQIKRVRLRRVPDLMGLVPEDVLSDSNDFFGPR